MKRFIKYIRPKKRDYQRLKTIEESGRKVTQLECKVEILQGKIEQLGHKNIQLRIINKRYAGLFGVFMCKCVVKDVICAKKPKDILNEIYLLSRKMLEEVDGEG